jgi:hypothetical protein
MAWILWSEKLCRDAGNFGLMSANHEKDKSVAGLARSRNELRAEE